MLKDVLSQYVHSAPCAQNALDIFQSEWSSKLPATHAELQAGTHPLFADKRIFWAWQQFGGFRGKRVLELGPLEGGHTYMLEQMGAAEIVAVEGNVRAYLKCLIVKELFGLRRARFVCGDIIEYLRADSSRFDICIACGVLYHMRNPVEMIELLARKSDRHFFWTHYYDAEHVQQPHLISRLTAHVEAEHAGFPHTLHRYEYLTALDSMGFCGGSAEYSHWLSLDDLMACLRHFGLTEIQTDLVNPTHPNGPSLSLAARKAVALAA